MKKESRPQRYQYYINRSKNGTRHGISYFTALHFPDVVTSLQIRKKPEDALAPHINSSPTGVRSGVPGRGVCARRQEVGSSHIIG